MSLLADPKVRALVQHLRYVGAELREQKLSHVAEKSPLDLVSALDLWAEAELTDFLRRRFPGDCVLSEESSSQVQYADRIWVLDPLDGTVNRVYGLPFFAISLALLQAGTPVLGLVYDPVHDELFCAEAGRGASLNGACLQLNADEQQVGLGLGLTSKLIRRLADQHPERLVELLTRHGRLRNLGSQALHLCYVACGRLAAAASAETRLWDNAAGALIVREAGGSYTDLRGLDPFPVRRGAAVLRGEPAPCLAGSRAGHRLLLEYVGDLE